MSHLKLGQKQLGQKDDCTNQFEIVLAWTSKVLCDLTP